MPFSATGFKPLTIIDRDGKELPLSFLAGGDSEGVLFLLWKQQMNFLMRKDEYFKSWQPG